jgi:hypothetical protein
MPIFLVQACLDDHTLAVTTATAKEAFAKADEWHETGRFTQRPGLLKRECFCAK